MSDERARWTAFYDRLEEGVRALAASFVGERPTDGPGWTFLAPPDGPLPAELVARHDQLLAQLLLLTDAAQIRMADLRRELDTLPHHGQPTPGTIAVGRALDVFG